MSRSPSPDPEERCRVWQASQLRRATEAYQAALIRGDREAAQRAGIEVFHLGGRAALFAAIRSARPEVEA